MIARVVLHEGDQPNVIVPNFSNARKLVQKELESEYVCTNSCYSQFSEDKMYSIQLQMAELGEPKHHKHTCPHPASNICQTLNCYFSKLSFIHKLVLRIITWQMISYFSKLFLLRK